MDDGLSHIAKIDVSLTARIWYQGASSGQDAAAAVALLDEASPSLRDEACPRDDDAMGFPELILHFHP